MASETDPNARTEAAPLTVDRGASAEPPTARMTTTPDSAPVVAGRYVILGMLGAGGMGTVYRARDNELDELVALKVLRRELAVATGMLERFRREVKLARRVTHKNVARMFDIGEHEGDRFLTMELVEGDMLGSYLARRTKLSPRDTIRLGRDVCGGLAAAHAADVLHRDLKPENIIVAPERGAVITDFGIARAVAGADPARTGGGIVGTPAYMAPEQVEGAADLDARADLYALGVMLFELLTGAMPWNGDSAFSIAAARLLRPPPDVRDLRPDVPAPLARLVKKLMARARDERPATAIEVDAALAELASEAPSGASVVPAAGSALRSISDVVLRALPPRAAKRKTVAVLPILNLAGADDALLADTLTEDIVDMLSTTSGLRVRPRGETRRHVHPERDAREIGRAHAVDVVVDGSLRRMGDVLRTSVRLVTVEDGFQLWASRYERPVEQTLGVAPEIAGAIAKALAAELAAQAAPIVADARAQEMFLRARNMLLRSSFRVSQDAVDLLREATVRAPDDARIAGTYALALARAATGSTGSSNLVDEARGITDRTLAAHPSQPEAVVALAFIHLADADLDATCLHLTRAMRLAPNSVEALDLAGRLLLEAKHTESGRRVLDRALAIDPELTLVKHTLARAHALDGDFDGFLELIGPTPPHPFEQIAFFLTLGRIALWHPGRQMRDAFVARLRAEASDEVQAAVRSLVSIVTTSRVTSDDLLAFDRGLPVRDTTYSKRRIAFHGQMRCELLLACGEDERGLAELKVANANGLSDLLWIEKCPLLDRVRDRPELAEVHRETAARAKRVAEILDPV
ncbi:MAG: protein kinase [Deltaproteobacteria bacterium]|nr:protein kinase [Deltaproteobacteria bacterium]